MATAVFAVLRGEERPPPVFWLASATGMVVVLGFIAASGGLFGGLSLDPAGAELRRAVHRGVHGP